MREEHVPVLIVGGGGAGLTASMLLARLGVDHLLVSARPGHVRPAEGARPQPAGDGDPRGLRRRRRDRRAQHAGRADGGDRLLRRLRRARGRTTGGGSRGSSPGAPAATNENWRAASPWRQLNLPQIRLEPILKAGRREALAGPDPLQPRAARARAGRRRRDAPSVRDNDDRRVLRGALRVPARRRRRPPRRRARSASTYEGLGVVTETATLHVSADFSRWARDPDVLIRWILSPQTGDAWSSWSRWGPSAGDPTPRSGSSTSTIPADDPRAQSDEQVEADVRDGDRPRRRADARSTRSRAGRSTP